MSQVLIGTVSGDGATYQVWAEENGAGGTDFTIKLTEGTGDLLGFFLNYADSNNSLGTNTNITATYFGNGGDGPEGADDINQVGSNANTMQGTAVLFDAGVQFAQPGQNDIDDGAGVSFTINGLTFADIDGMTFGIRSQATPGLDTPDIEADGSVKLIGTFDIPEPPPEDLCWSGVTQGYWGTHTGGNQINAWDDGISQTQHYNTVFDTGVAYNFVDDKGLLDILKMSGKGLTTSQIQELNLAKQGIAAVLNAADSEGANATLDFAFTKSDVIAAVNQVYSNGLQADTDADGLRDSEELQHVLDYYNHGEASNPNWNADEGLVCISPSDQHALTSLMSGTTENFLTVYDQTHNWTQDVLVV